MTKLKVLPGAALSSEAEGLSPAYAGCQQSSVSCDYRTEVPVSLLAVNWGPFRATWSPPFSSL